MTTTELYKFVMSHKNGGDRCMQVIARANKDGVISNEDVSRVLHFLYLDMTREDSFFNHDGDCNIELQTLEVINMFLMAKCL